MSISENLHNLGALIKTNLEKKGVTGLTGNEGLTTLANKILDIECNDSPKNVVANITGDSISLGINNTTWIISAEDVVIDWGDGTSDTVNNPSTKLSHTYTDGLNEHSIVFNGTVTSLGNKCFYSCSGLTSIVIPNGVTSLGTMCFERCSNLISVTIPDSITNFGTGCFWGCSSLTSIVIPNNVTNIGGVCFYKCSSLINYELYWETQPIPYDSEKMPNNNDTFFTIPFGTASIYEEAGYPLERLVERESTNYNKFHWESDEVYNSDNTFPARIWEVPINFRASFKLSTTSLMNFITESNYFEFGGFDKTIIIGGIDQDFSIVVDDNGTKTKLSSYGDLARIGGYAAQTGVTVDLSYVDGLVTVTLPNAGSISAEYILEDRSNFDFTIGNTSSISEVTIDEI